MGITVLALVRLNHCTCFHGHFLAEHFTLESNSLTGFSHLKHFSALTVKIFAS